MTTASIDWPAVESYYRNCRSYKKTADKFGLPVNTVRTRARRGKWTPDEHPVFIECSPLRALHNLTEKTTFEVYPWDEEPCERSRLVGKAEYRAYITDASTKDCLYSGFVGQAANLRVAHDNPPALLRAVVADYDTVISDEQRTKMAQKLAVPPTYVSSSYSGGTHAVWLLEKPIPLLPDAEMVAALLLAIKSDLKLGHAFGALDSNAFFNASQYIQLGWSWEQISDKAVSEERTHVWLSKALAKTRGQRSCPIPLSHVAREVERRFPGRWSGAFEFGARGVRFWDPSADNPTAAVVTENGMLCYTGPTRFMSWEAIFGADFAAEWEEASVGRALKEIYFCNNTFYVLGSTTTDNGENVREWLPVNRVNVETLLSTRYGLRSKASKDEDMSEVKAVVGRIIELNKVGAVAPIVYNDNVVVQMGGMSCLNTSFVRVAEPDMEKGSSWGDGFPWTAAFLERLFPAPKGVPNTQLERFVAEWAYAYRHAHAHNPKQGRVIFIVGPPGTGKNFLTERIYGATMGGYTDASNYLLGRTRFTGNLFNVGAWICNDSVAGGDAKERKVYTANLKQLAANQTHCCEAKFKNAVDIRWSGRVLITLNADARSQELLPDLDVSNSDKVSLYKTGNDTLNAPEAERKVREELPALCAYLLKLDFPEHCKGDVRWGVAGFLHPDLLREAKESGSTASFWQVLEQFLESAFTVSKEESLHGTSTWWLRQLLAEDGMKELLGITSPCSFGRNMASLAATGAYPITYRDTNRGREWCVNRKAYMEYRNGVPGDRKEGRE